MHKAITLIFATSLYVVELPTASMAQENKTPIPPHHLDTLTNQLKAIAKTPEFRGRKIQISPDFSSASADIQGCVQLDDKTICCGSQAGCQKQ